MVPVGWSCLNFISSSFPYLFSLDLISVSDVVPVSYGQGMTKYPYCTVASAFSLRELLIWTMFRLHKASLMRWWRSTLDFIHTRKLKWSHVCTLKCISLNIQLAVCKAASFKSNQDGISSYRRTTATFQTQLSFSATSPIGLTLINFARNIGFVVGTFATYGLFSVPL